jgi:small subunit ribosomal protein S20
MPHTHSAKKRMRQTEKRRAHNRAVKKAIRLQIRKLTELAGKGPADQVQAEFKATVKKLDKAASRRIIHPNTVARRKSHLAHLLKSKPPAAAGT